MFRLKKNGEPYFNCYCRHPELIENYDKAISDKTQTWDVHHRREEFYSKKELTERGKYFDVSPEDLIFLTREEHRKIDSSCKRISESCKGKKKSEKHKRKLSEVNKGKYINRKDISKKVMCVETGEVFDSMAEASRQTGVYVSNISMVCNGKRKNASGYHWSFVRPDTNTEN